MAISSWDDYPVHQAAEYVRHAATSDRNFYDRYYFNLHPSSDEYFAIFGLGQYPNLGVTDAFLCVATRDRHRVVRASRPLEDRMDVQVGPIRVEPIDPLKKVRVVCEPNEFGLAMDVVWEGSIPAVEEPRQYIRSEGKVVFDTQRFAQTGCWTGTITIGDNTHAVTPDRCMGTRDRSWGVRPVGEPEPDGIRQGTNVMAGMWNYFPMQFDDHAILYMNHETNSGERKLEEAKRIWSDPDRPSEWLGTPQWHHEFHSGTRVLKHSVITFPDAPEGEIQVECTPLLTNFLSIGTGYGFDADWRHGMYQGPDLKVQGKDLDVETEVKALGQYGVVDQVGRFEYGDRVGHGLYEHGFFGPFDKLGLPDGAAVAP
ncbi:MAG: hypothetical protein KDB21_02095 [Acidimicrobiales bacterium]|nr:hypothetical protein [Acidimicrobiales bacterium]